MKKLITALLGIILAILGEMLAYYVFASKTQGGFFMGFLGITAFVAIIVGIILTIINPIKYAEKLHLRLKGKSKWLLNLTGILGFFTFLAPFVAAVLVFYHFAGNYHDEQMAKFGIITKVKLQSEISGFNSRHDLCFSFTHEGKTIDGMLDHWIYEVGDSVEIIYSGENPNEVEWYKEYLENLKTE